MLLKRHAHARIALVAVEIINPQTLSNPANLAFVAMIDILVLVVVIKTTRLTKVFGKLHVALLIHTLLR